MLNLKGDFKGETVDNLQADSYKLHLPLKVSPFPASELDKAEAINSLGTFFFKIDTFTPPLALWL